MNHLLICPDSVPVLLGLFDPNIAPTLLFYSYIPIAIISIFFGFFIFFQDRKSLMTRIFLEISVLFSVFLLNEIVQWIAVHANVVYFSWSIAPLFQVLIWSLAIYFLQVFINGGKDVSFKSKLSLVIFALPVILLIPTSFDVQFFDLNNCEAASGLMWYYLYAFEVLSIVAILVISLKKVFQKGIEVRIKRQLLILTVGMVVFLGMFAASNIFGELTKTYQINLIGPIGMAAFLCLMTFLIVRFKAFNIKLAGAQALVFVIVFLVGSEYFFVTTLTNQILVSVTFVGVLIGGYFLVKSVKREIEQREKIEKLAGDLKIANAGQTNLIHVINHQLKGYLAKGRNVFAELLDEPSYCAAPESKPMIKEGFDSLTEGVGFIQQILNGSSAESGTMTYNMQKIDLAPIYADVTAGLKEKADAKSLGFQVAPAEGAFMVQADAIQIKEAIKNLVDNSIVYTPTGSVSVSLAHANGKILLSVKDSGIGLTDEDKGHLFTSGGRGIDSLKYNTNSTGYGLAFVMGVVKAHGGRVWAESEGRGKGSTFYMELGEVK